MSASPLAPAPRLTLCRALRAIRPAFLSITLVGCMLGSASAYASGVVIELWVALLSLLLAALAHAVGNVMNDYYDALSGTDALNTQALPPFTGGSRMIQNGLLSTRQTAGLGITLTAISALGGLVLVSHAGPGLLLIGAAGLALAWAYSAPPLQLVSRGLGEAIIAGCWLLVVIGADFVHRHSFAWLPVACGVSYALLVASILFMNQFPDYASDARTGKRTLVVRLGPEGAKSLYFGLILLAYMWLIIQVGRDTLPQQTAAAAFTLVLSFSAARELREYASTPAQLSRAIKLTIAATLAHGVILALTLVWTAR